MQELIKTMRKVKDVFDKKHIIKNCEGKPYFGEITIIISDGKLVHIKDVEESIKL